MSEWGEVPDDLDFKFPSVRVLTEEEKADMAEKGSAPVLAAYNAGVTGKKTTLKELRQLSDTSEIFSNITDEAIDQASDEQEFGNELEGLLGTGGGTSGKKETGEVGARPQTGGKGPMGQLRKLSGGALDSKMPTSDAEGTEADVDALMEHRSFGLVGKKHVVIS
jgi:hypothetical protein